MRAIRFHSYGDSGALKYEDVPIPEIGPGEAHIKVHSAGVNPVDWKIREGYLQNIVRHRLALIPGWDVAGRIECGAFWLRASRQLTGSFLDPAAKQRLCTKCRSASCACAATEEFTKGAKGN
jgi:D-arabinose 1-dehydrogenase-like Zn-dependent alcohol dehydrogenase